MARVIGKITRRVTTYGLSDSADITAQDVVLGPMSVSATVLHRQHQREDRPTTLTPLGRLELQVPGHPQPAQRSRGHRRRRRIGVPFEELAPGLREFRRGRSPF